MRRLRVQFSPMGQRWAVDLVGVDGLEVDVSEQGDVTISRDQRGRITSIVIDAARLESDVVETIAEEFGREIADLMSEPTDEEIDEIFTVDDQPGAAVIRGDSPRAGSPILLLPDEPGVPSPVGADRFRIVVDVDTRTVEGMVEHDRVAARVRIEIEITKDGEPLWARIAEGETGAILALAPLEKTSDKTSSVDMAFGLAVPMQTLHVSVSDEPLDDPGDRADRRRRWAEELEARAIKRARRARSDAGALFERAASIHQVLGDDEAAQRCRDSAKRARRRRRFLGGLGIVIALVAFGSIGARVGGSGVESSPPAVAIEPPVDVTVVETVPPLPPPVIPPEPGPVELDFGDGREVQLFIDGSADASPGDTIDVIVRTRLNSRHGFLRMIDCVSSESGISFRSGDGSLYAPSFVPRLSNLSDPNVSPRAFPPLVVDRAIETSFVKPGECEIKATTDGSLFEVDSVAVLKPTVLQLTLPDDLEPGSWRLDLTLERIRGVSPSGEYLTIRVTDR